MRQPAIVVVLTPNNSPLPPPPPPRQQRLRSKFSQRTLEVVDYFVGFAGSNHHGAHLSPSSAFNASAPSFTPPADLIVTVMALSTLPPALLPLSFQGFALFSFICVPSLSLCPQSLIQHFLHAISLNKVIYTSDGCAFIGLRACRMLCTQTVSWKLDYL